MEIVDISIHGNQRARVPFTSSGPVGIGEDNCQELMKQKRFFMLRLPKNMSD